MHYQHDNSEDGNLIHPGEGIKHGTSLDLLLDGKPLVLSVCLEVLAYVADILTETDKMGRFHGELTLENIKITPDGAVIVDGYPEAAGFSSIAPEKAITSIASDTYALGLIMIGLLAGHNRFKIPKEEDRHDDQIARIILSLDWQELSNQIWIENIQDFLVDTLSFFPSERPHPLDVANVLFELLPFTHGPNLKLYAADNTAKPKSSSVTEKATAPAQEWGEAVAIEAPVLRSVSIVPDSSQGAATGLWSRQKIAQMFNGELKSEERARREVWKPQEFDHDSDEESEFINSNPEPEPPPPALPDLPDLPPLDGFEMPNPIDNPDFFKTSQASLSTSQSKDPVPFSDASGEISLPTDDTIPPPPAVKKGATSNQVNKPAQMDQQPETAPISSTAPKKYRPQTATPSPHQSSPAIGLNIPESEIESPYKYDYSKALEPEPDQVNKPIWPWIVLGVSVIVFSGILGIIGYLNQDKMRNLFVTDQKTNVIESENPSEPEVQKEIEQEPKVDDEEPKVDDKEEPKQEQKQERERKPKAPPIPTTNQNSPSTNTNTSNTSSSNSSSTSQSTTNGSTSSSNSPPPPPPSNPPTTSSQDTLESNTTAAAETTPAPVVQSGTIRATITGITGKVSCGDGQQMEIDSSVTIEFGSPQACRLESNGERGAILIQQSGTYSCRNNNGAIECQ